MAAGFCRGSFAAARGTLNQVRRHASAPDLLARSGGQPAAAPLVSNSGPGPRPCAPPGGGKVVFQVSYKIIFPGQFRARRNRPDFIFNPSNDAWFGRWGPPQHVAQARLRAAEEGLPVIRSTPTGISAVIDAHGHIVASLPCRTAGETDPALPPPAPPTSLPRSGNLIPLLLGFALLIGGIAMSRTRR